MERVTVIGNGGAGKTTLSYQLADQFNLPLYHMDRLIWRANWERTPEEVVRATLKWIMDEPRWVIDGLGPLWSIQLRLPRADRIFFLDFPIEHCKRWALQRVEEFRNLERPDAPEGCTFNGLEERLLKLLDHVDSDFLPTIRDWVSRPGVRERTVWMRDPAELEELSAEPLVASGH